MVKKLLLSFMAVALMLSVTPFTSVAAETSYVGSVVKVATSDTLYYVASDGNRYVYPNANIYHSWYTDFEGVVVISAEEMAAIPLGGSIHYRPGVVLVKIQTDPKVYAVSENGKLRWVKTESLARKFYGENWANLVDDLQASFFANYHIGEDIDEDNDYDADEEVNSNESFEHSRGLALGHLIRHANTKRCEVLIRVKERLDQRLGDRSPRGLTRVVERMCKDDDDDDDDDTTKPVISNIVADAATSTAMITWTTNEAANSKVTYADESLATASSTDAVSNATLVTGHSLQLLGLTPSTTYHYIVESKDASGNTATSTERMFTTDSLVIPDTTAPIISSIVVTSATTTATITWMTNESATSKVTYADESLATASSTSSVSSGVLLTSHSLVLLGLTPSTTYFFMLESKDAANNTATSSQQMFATDN